jgi:hypothetical protein
LLQITENFREGCTFLLNISKEGTLGKEKKREEQQKGSQEKSYVFMVDTKGS